jgi:hypothetical protein
MPLSLTAVFADVPDPRIETANKLHPLTDILVIATCAVIAGADGWDEIAEYGRTKEPFFRRFLALPNGVPSHDTFERVFAKLDPDAFADRFGRWMAGLCDSTGLTHIAVDGKSARASAKDTFTGCLHLVSAWATESRLILGQRSVPEGGHEITTVPDLLAALDLRGGGDAGRGRVPEGDGRADPQAGRGVRGVREREPAGVARRGGRCVRPGVRRGVCRVRHGR